MARNPPFSVWSPLPKREACCWSWEVYLYYYHDYDQDKGRVIYPSVETTDAICSFPSSSLLESTSKRLECVFDFLGISKQTHEVPLLVMRPVVAVLGIRDDAFHFAEGRLQAFSSLGVC